MGESLVASGVSVRLGRRLVIHEQDFAFPRGWTALLGRNGAGKTTLLRALAGVQPLQAGYLRFDGTMLGGAAHWRRYRSSLGWMPQDPQLPDGMRVSELVEYAGWLKRIPRQQLRSALDRAMEAGGSTALSTRRFGTLSGGQRRRAALSCALVGAPRVLLLDEPSVGLDPEQREAFDEQLRALDGSVAVVYSTHLLEDVLLADRVCVIERGRAVFSGPVEEFTGGEGRRDIETLRSSLKRVAGAGDR